MRRPLNAFAILRFARALLSLWRGRRWSCARFFREQVRVN
jgi:hypothetical protein